MPTINGGQVAGSGSGLPPNWQNLPTTQASFNAAVQGIAADYGPALAQKFQSWYSAAWKKDRNLTPLQAASAWLTQQSLGPGIAATGTFVGQQVPQAATNAAENVANQFPKVPNPFHWLFGATGISGWFMRGLKVLFGGVLMILGIAKLTHAEGTITKIAPIAAKALL